MSRCAILSLTPKESQKTHQICQPSDRSLPVAPLPALPATALARGALELAHESEQPAILNHSIRTFLYANLAAGANPLDAPDDDLLFVAAVLHDIGTADRFDGPQRFEVEGADAAASYLHAQGLDRRDVDRVWEAIALHTSPGIAERRGPLTRLIRLAVRTDFGHSGITPELRQEIELLYPRLGIEIVLADAVVAQALHRPESERLEKAPPSSWPGGLLSAHLTNARNAAVDPTS